MTDKLVHLGSRLRYPITITKLLKSPGDSVKKQENIIEYKFSWRRRVGDNDEWTNETTYTEYDSPAEGVLKRWRIAEGQVIEADTPCMVVEEACGHEVQIQGLCSLCGADMTEINWATEERDTDRANINMTHDQTGLMVSQSVATKAEYDTQKRLLRQRKLSLVVDLDQTIIHACIDPTVGEWQGDPSNPNHAAVKDVKGFQLDDGPRGAASGFTYYIKLRPGLEEFLEEVSSMYELHVYTMGTRAYAHNIRQIVDPDRKLFGDRVISRDENGSITAKSLQRLFPVSTNMVVIIDDRADVWPMNRPNLIKVVPYEFFRGIGDINGSFLPKRQELVPTPAATPNGTTDVTTVNAQSQSTPPTEASPGNTPAQETVRVISADEEEILKIQAEEQEKTLEKQLADRPLQHMQEELDKEDEQGTQDTEAGDDSPVSQHHRQNLLTDDDEELIALQDHLTDLHTAFYDTYDKRRQENGDDGMDMSLVPDVGDILDELKSNVLEGLVIVLSGLVPLGARVEESEIGVQAQSFGAQVLDQISKRVTHLVVATSRPRTKKVQQAAKIPSIKIVNQNWLTDCLSQWRRLNEAPYYVDVLDADRERSDEITQSASEPDDEDLGVKDLQGFDWDTADKEMEDFLGLDDDDSDESDRDSTMGGTENGDESETDSNGTDKSVTVQGTKRKSRADESDDEPEGNVPGESALAKKQRVARARGASSLRSVRTPNGEVDAEDEGSSLPTPGPTTGDEEPSKSQTQDGGANDEENNYDDDLERDLLAELEAAEV